MIRYKPEEKIEIIHLVEHSELVPFKNLIPVVYVRNQQFPRCKTNCSSNLDYLTKSLSKLPKVRRIKQVGSTNPNRESPLFLSIILRMRFLNPTRKKPQR